MATTTPGLYAVNVGRLVFAVAVDNGASARGVGTSPRWDALKSGQAGGGPLELLVVEEEDPMADDEDTASDDDTGAEDVDEPLEEDVCWLEDSTAEEEDNADEETLDVATPDDDTVAEEPAELADALDDDAGTDTEDDAKDDDVPREVPDPALEEPERELAPPELLAVPLDAGPLVAGRLVPDMALLLPEVSTTKPLLDAVVTGGTSTQWLACTSHTAPDGQSASSTHAMDVTQPSVTTPPTAARSIAA